MLCLAGVMFGGLGPYCCCTVLCRTFRWATDEVVSGSYVDVPSWGPAVASGLEAHPGNTAVVEGALHAMQYLLPCDSGKVVKARLKS